MEKAGITPDLLKACLLYTSYIPMDELVDKKAELARLTKELESAQKQYATTQQKLSNEKFLSNCLLYTSRCV